MAPSQLKMTTCLWFDGQAEEAAKFYTSIFPNSDITHVNHFLEAGKELHGREPGSVMVVEFVLDGHRFVGLNGGPHVDFNHAISFQIDCADQAEVEYYYEKLGDGGDQSRQECGWAQDKYGVSWQIVPTVLKEMLSSEDKEAAGRAALKMMHSSRLNIAELEKAFKGEA
ncbi:3-demethylubiquinone-9 3-O-methyltransferase [Parathielavia hyrcaniae]|uniref:3-demethylubiquinone-9 3-O-methyltransferase n=1 Tax=Parathielavia hyrcaniae TaxID=113614 RepID=A0AAN6PXE3_9PEZI|nr:3-demethylubiquinone-9 3-O-methyltransferase [Parathielavia hyrcaniae]